MGDFTTTFQDDSPAIRALSKQLQVPERKVMEVYRAEFNRLAAQSRIGTFLSVLAMRNTRSLLRRTEATPHVSG
jgi:hypothetical protein